MGYGSRALQLLEEYYEGRVPCLSESEQFEKTTKVKSVEVALPTKKLVYAQDNSG